MRTAVLVVAWAATACASNALDSLLASVATGAQELQSTLAVDTTVHIGTQALIESFGYPVENHTVNTDDCYILTLFRIPKPGGRPVFFMHGLFSSSADWPIAGPHRALPLLLWDAGYDVWLGNARGNSEARQSCKYDPDKDAAFWDFSFHEIGVYDLPASIDYILDHTHQKDLHYVGFSQGTTVFFVMASEVPRMMGKIRTANLLAPVAYVRQWRSVPMRLIFSAANWPIAKATGDPRLLEFLPHSAAITALGQTFCKEGDLTQDLCYELIFSLVGTNWNQVHRKILPQLIANDPAGASLKQVAHYGQLLKALTDEFRQFDYGPVENKARYGTWLPPNYNLSRVTCDTTLVYGRNDLLSVESNVDKIQSNVASSTKVKVADPNFNHLDFQIAKDIKPLLNDGVIARIQSYDGL